MFDIEKIIEVIQIIKNFNLNLDSVENLYIKIYAKLELYFIRNLLLEEDIYFLIDLVNQNNNLSDNLLADLFINSKTKIEKFVILTIDDPNIISSSNLYTNNYYYTNILNIFSYFGDIIIFPKKIILLWNNEKDNINTEKELNSKIFYESNIKENLIIRKVNYEVINKKRDEDILKKYKIFDNLYRKIGIQIFPSGYKLPYLLKFKIENEPIEYTMFEFYKGDVEVNFNHKKLNTELNSTKDIEKLIKFYIKDLIIILKKNLLEYHMYIKFFLLLSNLQDFVLDFFSVLNYNRSFKKKKNYKEHITLTYKPIISIQKSICSHIDILKKILNHNQENDYYEKLNSFIDDFLNYKNGLATCKLCGENITIMNILDVIYIDKNKYITIINDDIFSYPLYNRFVNIKYFFEEFLYNFDYYFKINIIHSIFNITKLSVDNLVTINHNRLNLESQYNQEIKNNIIFLLRITNNFFNLEYDEKEKYYDKKKINLYLIIGIIVCLHLNLVDYNEILFVKKIVNIFKYEKDYNKITFVNILSLILEFFFTKLEIISLIDLIYGKKKNEFLNKAILTYLNIFNEETKYLYSLKKNKFESFFLNHFKKQYILYTNILQEYLPNSFEYRNYFYQLLLKSIYGNSDYLKEITYYNYNTYTDSEIINLYFDSLVFDLDLVNKDIDSEVDILYQNLLIEHKKKKYYEYNHEVYEIYVDDDQLQLYNNKKTIFNEVGTPLNIKLLNVNKFYMFFNIGDSFTYLDTLGFNEIKDIFNNFANLIYSLFKVRVTINYNISKIERIDIFLKKLLLLKRIFNYQKEYKWKNLPDIINKLDKIYFTDFYF